MQGEREARAPLEVLRALASGDSEPARAHIETALPLAGDEGLAPLLRLAELAGLDALAQDLARRGAVPAEKIEPSEPPPDGPEDDDPLAVDLDLPEDDARALDDARRFVRLFGGRADLYAEQYLRRERAVYRPVREPLDPQVALEHLQGARTLGQYLLFADGSCSFGVLDLDLDRDGLAELGRQAGGATSAVEHPALADMIRRLLGAARELGLRLHAFDSGRRGAHLWLLLPRRRAARQVQRVLGALLDRAGPPPARVSVEIFPKQTRPGPKGLSSLVKLPLGVHRQSLRRAHLLDAELRPIQDLSAALASLDLCPDEALDALAGRRVRALPSPELGERPRPQVPPPASPDPDLHSALRELEDPAAAAERVLASCPALAALVDRAHAERQLAPEEARAIVYTLGLLGQDGPQARVVLEAGRASRQPLESALRGRPQPMGCKRVGRLGPEGACRGCELARELPAWAPYATPTLRALSGSTPPSPRLAPAPFDAPLFEDPLASIGASLRRIERRLSAGTSGEAAPDEESSP